MIRKSPVQKLEVDSAEALRVIAPRIVTIQYAFLLFEHK